VVEMISMNKMKRKEKKKKPQNVFEFDVGVGSLC
jgi:hypothetical protein